MILVQYRTNAYRVEAGGYSDDAAHLMNGLVIRDYLKNAAGQDPMAFAENYYLNYPKIAPLMWPPLFHVALGLLLLAGGSPSVMSLLLVAAITAWLLWRLQTMVRPIAGKTPAVLAAVLTLATPLIASLSGVVMLDVAIAAIGLEAVYWLARFAQSGLQRHALLFGVFTACACLTKGNGVAIVIAPLLFILMTKRYDLFLKRGLYLAAAIVLICAAPILAISARFDAAIGDFGPVTWSVLWFRIQFYSIQLWRNFGPVLLVLSAAGLAIAFMPRKRQGTDAEQPLLLTEALATLVVAGVLFHLLVPHKIAVSRYLAMAIPPLIGLSCVAAWRIAGLAFGRPVGQVFALVLATVIAMGVTISRPLPRDRMPMGYREVIDDLARRGELAGARLLVVADEFGEGAFVTEAAVLGLQPAPMMLRGSKLLASDDWGGRFFKLRYASPAALISDLEEMQVAYVLLDQSPVFEMPSYANQILELAATSPARFELARKLPADKNLTRARSLTLYRVTSPKTGPPKPVEVSLTYSIGKTLAK